MTFLGSRDDRQIGMYAVTGRRQRATGAGRRDGVDADLASLSPDGSKLRSCATWDGTLHDIHVVDVDTGVDSGLRRFDRRHDRGLADNGRSWSPDGARLARSQRYAVCARIASGRRAGRLAVRVVEIGPQGRLTASEVEPVLT